MKQNRVMLFKFLFGRIFKGGKWWPLRENAPDLAEFTNSPIVGRKSLRQKVMRSSKDEKGESAKAGLARDNNS